MPSLNDLVKFSPKVVYTNKQTTINLTIFCDTIAASKMFFSVVLSDYGRDLSWFATKERHIVMCCTRSFIKLAPKQ